MDAVRDNTIVIFSSDNGGITANGASNGPLRGGKHTLYEGGIRMPFIVRWPNGDVPAGRVDETSVLNICDFVPTFAKLTGARMPDSYRSDGEDMIAALRGESFERTRPQFWHYQVKRPSLATRVGDWKLLMDPAGEKVELYDLAADPAESQDLSAGHPDVVASLRKALFKWRGQLQFSRAEN
ncbi:MAG: arylsulfatase A-like enzyme [Candidatus Binatia bacterium]|jgi:arylsulfatase A-like enzyme